MSTVTGLVESCRLMRRWWSMSTVTGLVESCRLLRGTCSDRDLRMRSEVTLLQYFRYREDPHGAARMPEADGRMRTPSSVDVRAASVGRPKKSGSSRSRRQCGRSVTHPHTCSYFKAFRLKQLGWDVADDQGCGILSQRLIRAQAYPMLFGVSCVSDMTRKH